MDNKRVVVAGLFHESHSFLDGRTCLKDFQLCKEVDLLSTTGGSPLAGVLEAGQESGWEIIAASDMRAMPGPIVEDQVIECFWGDFQGAVGTLDRNPLNGVLIIMHGAMVSESIEDVEGEILSRIRSLPQCANVPLCVVLDLHANVTLKMVRNLDALVAYRENPHTDAKAAAIHAAHLLTRLMHTGERPETVWEHPSIMWPPTGTATADEPMRSLERMAREIERTNDKILTVNVFAGFAFADIPDSGISFTATTLGDPEEARDSLRRLSELAQMTRELGNVLDPPMTDVFPKLSAHRAGPIVLVESSDNIGAGAPGSGISLLKGFLEHSIENAVVVINDPEAVTALKDMPAGSSTTLSIGGKGSSTYAPSIRLQVELVSRSDGGFDLEDEHSHLASMFGNHIEMGDCAVVRHKGVRILLTSRKTPPFDLGQLRSQGIEPRDLFVIGVKAAVAHRRAYDPITAASYVIDTPGPCSSHLKSFPYKNVRRPIYPLDS